jgi:pimeloyl-ACP methyl ester carboxylesterase
VTPLLLLPGLVCDRAIWAPLLPALAPVAQCVVADYGTLDALPAMAAHVLESAPPRFALVGHSMGGRVALEIMRAAPQRVERLALLDTGYQARVAGAIGEAERTQRHALLGLARREGMRAMGLQWLTGMLPPARLSDGALVAAIADMVARHSSEVFAAQIEALLNRPDATEVLRTIACPTLIACGRLDAWSPFARHEDMARLATGATLTAFEDCGHMAPMEDPATVASALLGWLQTPIA